MRSNVTGVGGLRHREGPTLETLDFAFYIDGKQTFKKYRFVSQHCLASHYVYFTMFITFIYTCRLFTTILAIIHAWWQKRVRKKFLRNVNTTYIGLIFNCRPKWAIMLIYACVILICRCLQFRAGKLKRRRKV